MTDPSPILLIAFVMGAFVGVALTLPWRFHILHRREHPAPSRTAAIANAQEQADIDSAIRRQSELHGRTHVHAGVRRASMERTR